MKSTKINKRTKDWYLKWVASCFIILGICFRSTQQFPEIDLVLSFIGCSLWTCVGFMWNDRAIIMLNAIATFVLLTGVINLVMGILYV